ncbi:MAG: hypothetical protein IJ934_02470 [Acetobacter sp.]|nr:hypothetical protein [Acetobacter sp.]
MNLSPLQEHAPQNTDMRIQEDLYGHRFAQDQEPFMIVLETLAVYSAVPYPNPNDAPQSSYSLQHRRKMRFLLFQDPYLERIITDNQIPDPQKWTEWKTKINQQFLAQENNLTRDDENDAFAYLDEKFSSNIETLYQAVHILRSHELDSSHNRRWTSRFLAVQGSSTICADMSKNWSPDRRFFGRGGELVYLMLNKFSDRKAREELNQKIHQRFLNQKSPINKIAEALSESDSADGKSDIKIGCLPEHSFNAYKHMAEDWLNLLTCDDLPDEHLFDPLFRITGLNLVVYFAEVAQKIRQEPPIPLIVDLTEGNNQHLCQEAENCLLQHREAANKAIDTFVKHKLTEPDYHQKWQEALKRKDLLSAQNILKQAFALKENENFHKNLPIEELLSNVIKRAQERSDNNIYKYLLPLTKGSGLVTARQKVKPRFTLNNDVLLALVLTNVKYTIPLKEFIENLYKRYQIVIGPEEARKAFGQRIRTECYEENLEALEKRLTLLSLAQRLSDDCAFVINPYKTKTAQ